MKLPSLASVSDLAHQAAGPLVLALGAGLVALSAASPGSPLARALGRYVAHLDGLQRQLFVPEKGRQILTGQGAALVLALAVGAFLPDKRWLLVLPLLVLGPALHLKRERDKRVASIEAQLDGFVLSLANALKTVPSPGAALEATLAILPNPTRQEIEQVLREVRIGSTLEEALLAMSARLGSKSVDVAFSAVLIGLRVGGNLPASLERTAATIREMNRLQGVVRTKTSEGRAQLWVLALFPLGAVFAFNRVEPGYFDPLQTTFAGQVAVGVAVVLWLSSILVARKVLTVDI